MINGIENLAERICELAGRVVERTESVAFMFGEVIESAPLTVKVEQRLILPEEILILTDPVIDYVEEIEGGEGEVTYKVVHKLACGDRVLLAKILGGEAYVILSRCYQTEAGK